MLIAWVDRFFGRFAGTNEKKNRGYLTVKSENHIRGQFDINQLSVFDVYTRRKYIEVDMVATADWLIYLCDELVIWDILFGRGVELIDSNFSTGTESEFPLLNV